MCVDDGRICCSPFFVSARPLLSCFKSDSLLPFPLPSPHRITLFHPPNSPLASPAKDHTTLCSISPYVRPDAPPHTHQHQYPPKFPSLPLPFVSAALVFLTLPSSPHYRPHHRRQQFLIFFLTHTLYFFPCLANTVPSFIWVYRYTPSARRPS